MADKTAQKSAQVAEELRGLVKRHELRGGMTQRDIESFLRDVEDLTNKLDMEGLSPKEIEQARAENNEPDPEKSPAELVKETVEADGQDEDDKGVKPQKLQDKEDVGTPANVAKKSTVERDKAEKAKVTAAKK